MIGNADVDHAAHWDAALRNLVIADPSKVGLSTIYTDSRCPKVFNASRMALCTQASKQLYVQGSRRIEQGELRHWALIA